MISAVNFGTSNEVYKGFLNGKTNSRGEKVVVMQREPDSLVKKTIKSVANAKKGYVVAKEGLFGIGSTVLAGLATGAAVLGLDWTLNKAAGRGLKDQSLLTTPFKTVGNLFASFAKKVASLPNKSVKEIVAYPFTKFPKQVYNYVKDIKGCSKFGKTAAVTVGVIAAGFTALGALIGINRAMADVDHGFRVGHNR